jgi:conjugal transfer mating pair stabilization protein TraN
VSLLARLLVGAAAAAGFTASVSLADPATQEAVKKDAQAFAKTLIPTAKSDANTQPTADSLPGYTADPSQKSYYTNPNGLKADAAAQASSNQGYSFVRDSVDQRPQIPQADLDATVSRSMAIQNDPSTYVSGFSAGGSTGNCHALPPGTGSPGTYEQSCNSGFSAGDARTKSCVITLKHNFTTKYGYSCGTAQLADKSRTCLQWLGAHCIKWQDVYDPLITLDSCSGYAANSGCTATGDTVTEDHALILSWRHPYYSTTTVSTYSCSAEATSPAGSTSTLDNWERSAPAPTFTGLTYTYLGSVRDESACAGQPGSDMACGQPAETCTDSAPQTRVINGVAITQSCWGWTRSYQCRALVATNDCSQLTNQGCTFARRDCLTDQTPCLTYEDVYSCPIPGNASSTQYICDGDIYCINGDCETIDRTPNTEFGQAAAALNSVAQAGKELDPNSLKIFTGERDTCTKLIAGLTNCCAPRGFPIVGGGCSSEDKILKQKKEQGLCHYVGSYCSSSILGICLKKKEADCCYLSKLSRIIQEQGRPQLGLTFGTAKHSTCDGFTVDQFSHLDLSKIDFCEIMADFVNAAKLPVDLQTANTMQAKIQAYYGNH